MITSPAARPVPILMYHSVSAEATPAFHRFALHPARFAEHMAFLAAEGYATLTVSELMALRAAGAEVAPRTVVLTFDDGFADFHDQVLPLLRRYGFTSTLYVVTGFVGDTGRWLVDERESDRPLLSWSQLAEVSESGVECGAHSHTHPQLDRIPDASVRGELRTSKAVLEDRLQRAVDSFAYPFGFHNRRVRSAAREAGFDAACAVAELVSSDDDAYAIPRLTVPAGTDVCRLAALLKGGTPTGGQKATVEAKRLLWQGIRRYGPASLADYLSNSQQGISA